MERGKEKADVPITNDKGIPPVTAEKGLFSNAPYGYYNYSQEYHHSYPPAMAYPPSYPPSQGFPPPPHGYPPSIGHAPQGYPPQGYPYHGYSSPYGKKFNLGAMLPMLAGSMAAAYGMHHHGHGGYHHGHGYHHHGKMKFGKSWGGYGRYGYHGKFKKWK